MLPAAILAHLGIALVNGVVEFARSPSDRHRRRELRKLLAQIEDDDGEDTTPVRVHPAIPPKWAVRMYGPRIEDVVVAEIPIPRIGEYVGLPGMARSLQVVRVELMVSPAGGPPLYNVLLD